MTTEELLAQLKAQRGFMVQTWIKLQDGRLPLSRDLQLRLAGYDQALIEMEEAIRDGGTLLERAAAGQPNWPEIAQFLRTASLDDLRVKVCADLAALRQVVGEGQ